MSKRGNRPANRWGCKPHKTFCFEHNLPTLAPSHYWCEKSWRAARSPVAGDVYTKKMIYEHRRVLYVGSYVERPGAEAPPDAKDKTITRVCYSNGSNTNHWCSLDTFMNWRRDADLVKKGEHVEAV